VAGFRTGHNLAWGHYLYVDDLSTRPDARRRGHGRALLEEAKRLGCDQFHLDSGVGLDRADAHRLYLNAGLVIAPPPLRVLRKVTYTFGADDQPTLIIQSQ
jgi:GNAT superfamily N-acetyltransferase